MRLLGLFNDLSAKLESTEQRRVRIRVTRRMLLISECFVGRDDHAGLVAIAKRPRLKASPWPQGCPFQSAPAGKANRAERSY